MMGWVLRWIGPNGLLERIVPFREGALRYDGIDDPRKDHFRAAA